MGTKQQLRGVELKPDAWSRFERFIRDIAKSGPQHRKPKPKRQQSMKELLERDDGIVIYELDRDHPDKIVRHYIRFPDGTEIDLTTASVQ